MCVYYVHIGLYVARQHIYTCIYICIYIYIFRHDQDTAQCTMTQTRIDALNSAIESPSLLAKICFHNAVSRYKLSSITPSCCVSNISWKYDERTSYSGVLENLVRKHADVCLIRENFSIPREPCSHKHTLCSIKEVIESH